MPPLNAACRPAGESHLPIPPYSEFLSRDCGDADQPPRPARYAGYCLGQPDSVGLRQAAMQGLTLVTYDRRTIPPLLTLGERMANARRRRFGGRETNVA